jgi:hypothetical protein
MVYKRKKQQIKQIVCYYTIIKKSVCNKGGMRLYLSIWRDNYLHCRRRIENYRLQYSINVSTEVIMAVTWLAKFTLLFPPEESPRLPDDEYTQLKAFRFINEKIIFSLKALVWTLISIFAGLGIGQL